MVGLAIPLEESIAPNALFTSLLKVSFVHAASLCSGPLRLIRDQRKNGN